MKKTLSKHFLLSLVFLALFLSTKATENPPQREYYAIRIYHLANQQQEAEVERYLQKAFVPAVHRTGIKTVGVFKPVGNDTATDRKIYVLMPFKSFEQFQNLPQQLQNDKTYLEAGKDYLNIAYNQPLYTRFETILLYAFEKNPALTLPGLTGPKSERVYELRSYESPGENFHINKVQMFNKGDEVGLFKRLGFNAVFYAQVLSGSKMPNLMYMTTFENMKSREAHWNTFRDDPYWKKLSAMPEYQHNVSKADILFLTPTDYSDF
jgi:NIPSNAP